MTRDEMRHRKVADMEGNNMKRYTMAGGAAVVMAVCTAITTEWQLGSVLWPATLSAFIGTFVAWVLVYPLAQSR
ncbi:hypothetical protein [Geomicrobium sp. JSM 1781026]|uniref:hypothetical protein n=1 Tax=Geomicrobium sp. JSM 1781026 TaxID=3344580 RepID=UPI0035C0A2CD